MAGRISSLRTHLLFNPAAAQELRMEHAGGFPAEESHAPHLAEAIGWLERAQDATPDDGFARGYSIAFNRHFGARGWQASYPETTGYIIPTLYEAAEVLGRPELAARATRAARWEIEVQLPSGAVQGGVIGEGRSPAVFNTGQVIFGWLRALELTGEKEFGEAARRAGRFLVQSLDEAGNWRSGNSLFANSRTTLYNARATWALAEAGVRLNEPEFTAAARRNLHAVAARQHANGWFPDCCLTDPVRPLLHTIAYTVRGLLEGGRVLQDEKLLVAAESAAEALLPTVRADGWMPGRFAEDWSGAVSWSCLTGEAQMANNWMRLYLIRGDRRWLEPVPRVLQFLKRTQNRTHADPGIRGGIKGSNPLDGGYGHFEILNWATKYFADALMRHDQLGAGTASARAQGYSLA
ncbi:MAG TPA: hypothetical protein VJN95_11325 [Gemmatimonadales bacterium]|nr:hypothetical protein [Gemmatimonadales bacterium]